MKVQQKSWMLKISTLVVVTACFTVLFTSLLVSRNLSKLLAFWGEDIQITVYLSEESKPEERKTIHDWLLTQKSVEKVAFIDQQKAFESFQAQLSSYAPNLNQDPDLLQMIPESFEVKLKDDLVAGSEVTTMANLKSKLMKLSGVEEISYGQEWVEKYSAIVSGFKSGFNGLGFILSIAVLFIISNVVRTSVFSRHEEIVVLEMIGASFKRIRQPFLFEGGILGLVSSGLALIICYSLFLLTQQFSNKKLSFLKVAEHIEFFSLISISAFLFMGAAIGALASYLCVRSLNDGFSGRQRGHLE